MEESKSLDSVEEEKVTVRLRGAVYPDKGFLRVPGSAILYTVGAHKLGRPEVVLYLGPPAKGTPVPVESANDLVDGTYEALCKPGLLGQLMKTFPPVFSVGDEGIRRFARKELTEESKEYLRRSILSPLLLDYKGQSFEFVLYESVGWLH